MTATQPLTSRTLSVARSSFWALLAQDVTHCPFRPYYSTTYVTPDKALSTKQAFGYSTPTEKPSAPRSQVYPYKTLQHQEETYPPFLLA